MKKSSVIKSGKHTFVLDSEKKRFMEKHAEMLDAIFRYATEGIIVSNTEGIIVMANIAVEKLFGYQNQEMTGLPIDQLVPLRHKQKHAIHREKYLEDPHPRNMGLGYDLYARRKNNSIFPVEISLSHFSTTEGKFVLSFVSDITTRKQQEAFIQSINRELEEYSKALENSNKGLEQFASIASHDLQEPLRKTLAYANRLLTKEQENLSNKGQTYVEGIVQATHRMHKLITDLLEYSILTAKPEAKKQVNLSKVLEDVLSDMEVTIEHKQAQVNAESLPSVSADETQMRQLFQNLISNACKFVNENESPVIHIYAENINNDELKIYIQDEGIGFDPTYTNQVFSAFQRLEGRKYEGTGMGLAICKRIAENHGGSISAESKPGEGATFIVTLPLN